MKEYTKKPESQSRTLDHNPKASGQASVGVIFQRYQERNTRQYIEDEEEMIQGKFSEPVQRERKSNNTGLPDNLKTGVENLSGYSLDDVKVHYNSDKPAQLQALAYTQGTDIHVGPGQEKHLPHEAWHVVQQKQGRVRPTVQMQGVNVNDNEGLEKEADVMGDKANTTIQMVTAGQTKQTRHTQRMIVHQDVLQMFPTIVGVEKKAVSQLVIEYIKEKFGLKPGEAEQILGKKKLLKDTNTYPSIAAFVDSNLTKEEVEAYFLAVDRSIESKKRGDETESSTASIIGGKVNRGKGGRDVEWRMIPREKADELKGKYGKGSDQELFESWSEILSKENDPDLQETLSTPVDAFSSTHLALAGGPAKFERSKPLKLEQTAKNRIDQLKEVAKCLGYIPVLVFSADTTCAQCRAVVADCAIDVFHLGEKQDDLEG